MQHQYEHMEATSPRTQKIIEFLVDLWQKAAEPSSETLKRRLDFVLSLPEPYKSAALTAIADQLASNLILHFIDVMATFQEKAEQEGIDAEEREEYLHYILTEAFPKLVGINRAVSVQSLDSLATLSNITVNLQILSQADSAETAQSWMYELSDIYPADLQQEQLVTQIQNQQKEGTADTPKHSPYTDWSSYTNSQSYVVSGTSTIVSKSWAASPPRLISFSLEVNSPAA